MHLRRHMIITLLKQTLNLKPAILKCAMLSATLMSVPVSLLAQNDDFDRWVEPDSAAAIKSRLLSDFRYTYDQARDEIARVYGDSVASHMREFADNRYIETKIIDGVERVHYKSIRNLKLLNPLMNGGWKLRGGTASEARIGYVTDVISASDGDGKTDNGASRKVKYRFSIDIPYNPNLAGDTLRVWMPMVFENGRQSDIRILSASQDDYTVSTEDQSLHTTVFMEQPVTDGKTTHFEYVAEYVAKGQYYSPDYIMANIKPYDKTSAEYKKYTAVEKPHIIYTDLAREIVGDETNPYRQSEMVYDYIINRYPWAGAREYSTISCIPAYVLREGHGDCGQVALLYISMMRSLGVPARWESGWMLHPGEKNLHDWAEVYYEGVGWVPVDVSFGRYTPSSDERVVKFYSTGMDVHRMSVNRGVCGSLYPQKKYVRSETVDFQLGEVESTKGNLFYPVWTQSLDILE